MRKSIIRSFTELKPGEKVAVIMMSWLWVPILMGVLGISLIIFLFKVGVKEWIERIISNLSNLEEDSGTKDMPYGST